MIHVDITIALLILSGTNINFKRKQCMNINIIIVIPYTTFIPKILTLKLCFN